MRCAHISRYFFAVAAVASLVHGQDKAAIQKKLESIYSITQATADRTDIVTAGSILVLQKSNLLMTQADKNDLNQNKYQDGKIGQNAIGKTTGFLKRLPGVPGVGQAPQTGVATRTFVKGEKMWVTKIEVKDNTVVFELFTDQMGDFRYRALLTFFGKGPLPGQDDVVKTVAEVFTVQPPDNTNQAPATDQQQAAPAAAPAPAAAAAPAPIPPPPPPPDEPPAPPKTISLGQTPEDVAGIFGQPDKKAKVGTKEIWYYKDLKVTFVNGKVSDVQ